MPITIQELKDLMAKATPGPWEIHEELGRDEAWCDWHRVGPYDLMSGRCNDDDRLLAKLPDIARLALELAEEVERLKIKAKCRHESLADDLEISTIEYCPKGCDGETCADGRVFCKGCDATVYDIHRGHEGCKYGRC